MATMAVFLKRLQFYLILTAGALAAILYSPLRLRYQVLGFGRSSAQTTNIHGHELKILSDTHCVEDLHYHRPSGLLFGASEADVETRKHWFPPTASLQNPESIGQGTIVVIDPQTFTTTRLALPNFPGLFSTHGIDIWSSLSNPDYVSIFAVNHLPNPSYQGSPHSSATEPKARSQIELFYYHTGEDFATHVRSIWHPLIRTPNDVFAVSSNQILVTNDHFYREGSLRLIEDVGWDMTPWSNIIDISFDLDSQRDVGGANASAGITASIALSGQQNMNGLGHGVSTSDVLIGRASAGVLVHASRNPAYPSKLQIIQSMQLDSTIDNPVYFSDPYPEVTGRDASGYLLAGLLNAAEFPAANEKDPAVVWMLQPLPKKDLGDTGGKEQSGWNRTVVFQDDGNMISSASTAVAVAIDPAKNEGKKQAWLFVTGPLSKAIVAARIDL